MADNKKFKNILENTINELVDEITAYHGTDADFDNFDLAYMGSGTGKQDFGYGIYLTLYSGGTQFYGKKLYTVEIPSNNRKYLIASKFYPQSIINVIKLKLYNIILKKDDSYKGAEKELWQDMTDAFNDMDGISLYGTIETYLGSDKETSELLYSMGFIGLKYNNSTVENVVMFNPKDIKIVNKGAI